MDISAAIAIVLAIAYDQVFFLAYRVDEMHSSDIGEIRSSLLSKIIADAEGLISVIDHREPEHHGAAADALELLDLDARSLLLSIRGRQHRLCRCCLGWGWRGRWRGFRSRR